MAMLVQRHFYTLFASIPGGGMQFITDTPDPLPPGPPTTTNFRHWNLPAWLPRKLFINRAIVCYESSGFNTAVELLTPPPGGSANAADYFYWFMRWCQWWVQRSNTETMMWVDPGGKHYSTATPPGSETSDFSPLTVIMHQFTPCPMMNYDTGDWAHPIMLNRDAGDKLAIQFNNADFINWVAVAISFLDDAS